MGGAPLIRSTVMRKQRQREFKVAGFTLIELMMTVAIVGILAMVALPSYQSHIRKSRRTEAKSALLDLAGREERLFSTTNAYSNDLMVLGYSATSTTSMNVGNGYYQVIMSAGVGPPPTFTIIATPVGGQVKDTTCASFKVLSTGVQSSVDSSAGDTTSTCWK